MSDKVRIGKRIALAVLAVLGIASMASANGLQAQLHLGRMWTNPENDGAESDAIEFPAGIPKSSMSAGDFTTQQLKRNWVSHGQKSCHYLFTQDWVDPDGVNHSFMSSFYFRTGANPYPKNWGERGTNTMWNWVLPVDIKEVLRFPRPPLLYAVAAKSGGDSLASLVFFPGPDPSGAPNEIKYPTAGGTGGRPLPTVDPNLVTEEMIRTVWRYIQGAEVTRDIYGYSLGSPHQDYYLHDMYLTNNGITGRAVTSSPIDTLRNQTLKHVIWAPGQDCKDMGMSGAQQGADEELMFIEPWGAGVHTAMLSFDGDADDASVPGADWGDPGEAAYWNQLAGNGYTIYGPLFASLGPGAQLKTDDFTQPAFRVVVPEKGLDIAGTGYPMDAQQQLEWMTDGTLHQPLGTRYQDTGAYDVVQSASAAAGPTAILGFGTLAGDIDNPTNLGKHGWTLGPMDSMHVVMLLACSGLDYEVARGVGARWAQRKSANPSNPSLWMSADDIALVKTGFDSSMKAAALAWYNYYGSFASNVTQDSLNKWGLGYMSPSWHKPAQYGKFNVPDGPRPPEFLAVTRVTSPHAGIEVRWGTAAETATDQDLGTADFAGYRVYRWSTSRMAPKELIAEGPAAQFALATAKVMNGGTVPAGRVYLDTDVTPGQEYWYGVVAYDDGTANWERQGKSLPSTMWWTWSGYLFKGTVAPEASAIAERAEPGKFVLEQNAPNPFNPTTTIRFSLAKSGDAKLAIYNTAGQLVRTLVDGDTDAGVHTVVWDGADNTGRQVSSGVYVYRLVSGENHTVHRMVLVR